MIYQLKDILDTEAVIAESNEIADLWQALDNQHFMLIPSLVITKGDDIVAGENSMLDRMKKLNSVDFMTVARSI